MKVIPLIDFRTLEFEGHLTGLEKSSRALKINFSEILTLKVRVEYRFMTVLPFALGQFSSRWGLVTEKS